MDGTLEVAYLTRSNSPSLQPLENDPEPCASGQEPVGAARETCLIRPAFLDWRLLGSFRRARNNALTTALSACRQADSVPRRVCRKKCSGAPSADWGAACCRTCRAAPRLADRPCQIQRIKDHRRLTRPSKTLKSTVPDARMDAGQRQSVFQARGLV